MLFAVVAFAGIATVARASPIVPVTESPGVMAPTLPPSGDSDRILTPEESAQITQDATEPDKRDVPLFPACPEGTHWWGVGQGCVLDGAPGSNARRRDVPLGPQCPEGTHWWGVDQGCVLDGAPGSNARKRDVPLGPQCPEGTQWGGVDMGCYDPEALAYLAGQTNGQ